VLGWAQDKEGSLLAEIFILRLEAAARVPKEAASFISNNAPFVPFTQNSQFTFKDGTALVGDRLEEAHMSNL
jgi:hypothetical protein